MHADGERTAAWLAAQERNHARRAQGEGHEAGINVMICECEIQVIRKNLQWRAA